MRPLPSRDDVAMELIFRECGTDHDFPQTRLEPTETETDRHGHIVNVNRLACRRCGTVKVTRWHAPDPAVSPQSVLAIGSFERPRTGRRSRARATGSGGRRATETAAPRAG